MTKQTYRLLALGLALVLSVASGRAAITSDDVIGNREEAYEYVQTFTEVLMQIRQSYVDEDKISYKNLIHGALNGMLKSLDPHSQFMPPKAYDDMKEDTSGKFSGVGIVIGMRDGRLTVISPIEDTPAFRAGIESDDVIVKINGEATKGTTLQQAVSKLRGQKDTKVQVTISRSGEEDKLEFEIVRDDIKLPSVKGTGMLNDDIGYIRIIQFNELTADHVHAALTELLDQEMKALVIDLRGNPGGLLKSAISVTAQFLKKDDLIVSTRGRRRVLPARSGGENHHAELPLAILVNRGTASASEIVAGALQDHKRATLVGQRTFGKGSVQSVLPLSDGSAIRMTTARYFTPSERIIHDTGIEPDHVVPITQAEWRKVLLLRQHIESPEREDRKKLPKELEHVVDRQLQMAVEILTGVLIFIDDRAGG